MQSPEQGQYSLGLKFWRFLHLYGGTGLDQPSAGLQRTQEIDISWKKWRCWFSTGKRDWCVSFKVEISKISDSREISRICLHHPPTIAWAFLTADAQFRLLSIPIGKSKYITLRRGLFSSRLGFHHRVFTVAFSFLFFSERVNWSKAGDRADEFSQDQLNKKCDRRLWRLNFTLRANNPGNVYLCTYNRWLQHSLEGPKNMQARTPTSVLRSSRWEVTVSLVDKAPMGGEANKYSLLFFPPYPVLWWGSSHQALAAHGTWAIGAPTTWATGPALSIY